MNPETTRRVVGGLIGGAIALMISPWYVDQSLPNVAKHTGTFFGMAIGVTVGAFFAAPLGMEHTEVTTLNQKKP